MQEKDSQTSLFKREKPKKTLKRGKGQRIQFMLAQKKMSREYMLLGKSTDICVHRQWPETEIGSLT